MWEVEYTDEFGAWWNKCTIGEQEDIAFVVRALTAHGPNLKYPQSSGVIGSKFTHMRELRVQHRGEPYRILYAFDPRRVAILLIGGCKTGNDRWYDQHIKIADVLYEAYLREITHEVAYD